ncbi:flagellar hook protein FlgE [Nitrosospira sp. Nsp5]|jgi:flagellar hook protein FlgE|uniref:Flagellar hook protein FlgE n=1 Tax=Nitrosospira multiformis TaxID=1231 RepID=A0ABY0TJ29_9PROT|nr:MULTISPECIES: flagellar hook protein FlgE [Nitrosospira]PTR09015.1 flagellar hook protein FlgE [Nitrosospira sp. Nsp5]SDQ69054.1 flagellar hook protein FlgE [Nitrosospira multiformis]
MSFQQGLSGLNAAARNLDVIGNNVANTNTVGFKQSQAQFADVYANSLSNGTQPGLGVKVAAVAQQFSQGGITASNNSLDIAISGNGFYRLSDQGSISYSRNGQFHPDKDGYIVNSSGLRLTGYTADAAGQINAGAPSDIQISTADLPPRATTSVNTLVNLDSREAALSSAAFDPADSTTYHSFIPMPIHDSLGNSSTVSTYFVKTAANSWDVFAASEGTLLNGGAPLGALNFLSTGGLDPSSSAIFSVTKPVTTGANSVVFDMDFTGTTQFGSNFGVNALAEDGYASGRLTGFDVGADGMIRGSYSSGKILNLGQVVLANFSNPQGLQIQGDNTWTESSASGAPLVGAPNTGGLGSLQSGAVEDSNVELTSELVNMITAQRVYQANAQTIKTYDQLLQTLVNLR